jgi:hypothetical protein
MTIAPVQQTDQAPPSTTVKKEGPASKGTESPAQDTVRLSSAALAALLPKPAEATETAAQTLAEAGAGDPKALAMLATK